MIFAVAEPIRPVLSGAFVGVVGLLAGMAVVAVMRRPSLPPPQSATRVLYVEPPAVVNLLTNGFVLTSEVVPATLLDLAARGVLSIELVAGGEHVIRTGSRELVPLTAYEDQLLAHIEDIAVNGVVPAGALTTGPKDIARSWLRGFRAGVIADAKTRGLSRDRWDGSVIGLGLLGLFAVGFVYAFAVRFDSDVALGSPEAALVGAGLVGAGALLVRAMASDAQRETPDGSWAASRWLGVREGLSHNEALLDLPPAAVTTYERHLAYAAAMGLAPGACGGLPLGAEDDRVAWSHEGGRWRRVTVRYPRFRPGWGLEPRLAIWLSIAWLVAAVLILVWLWPFDPPGLDEGLPEGIPSLLRAIQLMLGGAAFAVLVGAVGVMAQAIDDLGAHREITGTVVRMRDRKVPQLNPWRKKDKFRYYVALDDGTSSVVLAWSVRWPMYALLRQGQRAKATVSPRLRHAETLVPL